MRGERERERERDMREISAYRVCLDENTAWLFFTVDMTLCVFRKVVQKYAYVYSKVIFWYTRERVGGEEKGLSQMMGRGGRERRASNVGR